MFGLLAAELVHEGAEGGGRTDRLGRWRVSQARSHNGGRRQADCDGDAPLARGSAVIGRIFLLGLKSRHGGDDTFNRP